MKIFITGVAGFLGSNLADYYIKKNYKVFGCDNLVGGDLSNLNKKIVFYRANCENFASMLKIIKNVDVVCHAAAYAHEGLSVFSPSLITKNIIATKAPSQAALVKEPTNPPTKIIKVIILFTLYCKLKYNLTIYYII
jgi:UDP-glucose 4-epimerase